VIASLLYLRYSKRRYLQFFRRFNRSHGLRFLREFDLPMLRRFRASWPNENLGALKKLEYFRVLPVCTRVQMD
jgi:hypothetical protein